MILYIDFFKPSHADISSKLSHMCNKVMNPINRRGVASQHDFFLIVKKSGVYIENASNEDSSC